MTLNQGRFNVHSALVGVYFREKQLCNFPFTKLLNMGLLQKKEVALKEFHFIISLNSRSHFGRASSPTEKTGSHTQCVSLYQLSTYRTDRLTAPRPSHEKLCLKTLKRGANAHAHKDVTQKEITSQTD